jgi:hypothetical protein
MVNMKKSFITLTTLTLILLMIVSFHPQIVFADGETPTPDETAEVDETPPPQEPTEEVEQDAVVDPTTDVVDPTNDVELTPDDESTTEESELASTPEPGETPLDSVATPEETGEAPEQTEPEVEQPESPEESSTPSVSEVLDQAPEGTQLVVLDNEGQVEPLASQEAANIVNTGDPMWCPSGTLPGDATCSSSYNSFEDLLVDLGLYSGDGTIYVAYDYDSSQESADILLDGTVYTNLGALTIQGGWDGNTGGANLIGTSTFDGVSMAITNWGGQVTVNDVIFNTLDEGLAIDTNESVTLNNVNVNSSVYSDGITVESDGDVNLSDVESSSNAFNGATIISGGSVSVENSTFENNNLNGAEIYSNGSTNIQNSTFSSNIGGGGLYIEATDEISLSSVTASDNKFTGASLQSDSDVTISNSTFNGNDGTSFSAGLEVDSPGTVTLSSVTASNNLGEGVAIYAGSNVYLTNVTSTNNGWDGAYVAGDCITVYVNSGAYTGNGFGQLDGFGIYMETGEVRLSGSPLFNNNYSGNLFADPGSCYQIAGSSGRFYFEDNYNPIIQLTNSEAYYLACLYDTITLITQIDNRVTFEGVCDLDAIVADLTQEDPRTTQIPGGMTFVNGISLELRYESQLITRLFPESNITMSFVIPNGMENEDFTIFYYGNNQWVKISKFVQAGNRILVSGSVPGIYIIAKN